MPDEKLINPPKNASAAPGKIFIKEGAVFIADAHFLPEDFGKFSALLKRLRSERAQVILLGDFFTALFGGVKSSQNAYEKFIAALEESELKIYYFEGNHDFRLNDIFKKIKIFSNLVNKAVYESREFNSHIFTKIRANACDKSTRFSVLRASGFCQHGDVFLPPLTQRALGILRSKWLLKIANWLDLCGWIFAKILRSERAKKHYKKLENFEQISLNRLENLRQIYGVPGLVIEGHFHQGESYFSKDFAYYNLAAFAQTAELARLGRQLKITCNLH